MWILDFIVILQYVVCVNLLDMYCEFVKYVNEESGCYVICGLFRIKSVDEIGMMVISFDKVELVDVIVKCFVMGVMFFGLIFKEVYLLLVIVMNWIGGKLNMGEGGEELEWFNLFLDGLMNF